MRPAFQVTMTMRDLHRLKCIQAVVDGELRPSMAAERLQMSARQIQRLVQHYRCEGPVGLLSRSRNRPSNHRIDAALECQVLQFLRASGMRILVRRWRCEKLAERHQIVLAKETVRRIQITARLWIPRKLRPPKIQQPRTRRACVGELIQIDGCEHHWCDDRAPMCTALGVWDDATSRADDGALCRHRVHVHVVRGAARLFGPPWQAAGGRVAAALRAAGAQVELIHPDEDTLATQSCRPQDHVFQWSHLQEHAIKSNQEVAYEHRPH